jgi:hypothetical protein
MVVVIGTLKKVRGGGLSLRGLSLLDDSIMHDCWEIFKVECGYECNGSTK